MFYYSLGRRCCFHFYSLILCIFRQGLFPYVFSSLGFAAADVVKVLKKEEKNATTAASARKNSARGTS
jgi:hypothetical protein